jgi:ABC-2 type transport system permease protein
MSQRFSWSRLWALIIKEWIQIHRDKGTLAMIIAIPLMQVILFGFAINSDPRHLPTMVIANDQSSFTQSIIAGLQNSSYFDVKKTLHSEAAGEEALRNNDALFVVNIPTNFSRDVIRGDSPQLLIQADSTDPSAVGGAVGALQQLVNTILTSQLQGKLNYLLPTPTPFQVNVHHKYNPESITQYNIVPGLTGVVITMTMVMITSLAITRERERNTMEGLLATPLLPSEVMLGKILPYIAIGYIQMLLILITAKILFSIPMIGSITLLMLASAPFIAANLAVGLLFSTIARNQLEAVQMTIFFLLPSLLLSGFMFPFKGMPIWAQYLGSILPLTHFLPVVRGILLKGNGWVQIWPELLATLLFLLAVLAIGIKRFHRTLD